MSIFLVFSALASADRRVLLMNRAALLRGESENSEGFSNPLPADEICYESSFIRCNAQVFGNRSRLHRYFPFTRDFLSPL